MLPVPSVKSSTTELSNELSIELPEGLSIRLSKELSKGLSETAATIFKLIYADNYITRGDIAKKIGISVTLQQGWWPVIGCSLKQFVAVQRKEYDLYIITQFFLHLPNCLYTKKSCNFFQSYEIFLKYQNFSTKKNTSLLSESENGEVPLHRFRQASDRYMPYTYHIHTIYIPYTCHTHAIHIPYP